MVRSNRLSGTPCRGSPTAAAKAERLGTVEAADEHAAIEKAAKQYGAMSSKLMAASAH
jgi:hypothetical protein